ncbi:MAG TPA: UDP-3-O-(3-hydroxymyristoyl)glucosamine N-acyltransferase [Pyrinomonadaceae bacterium]|jgi:UDP-3-O-[3-hydroxymyristoyl] glucosamine N-acyltransferase|nr:UDP-3-O-(3-hydroxymyristoyl)glucosamine N-acyltransferase [Pyrinomonadaceae bacterium]
MSRQAEGRTVAELAALVGGRASGDAGALVVGVASIEGAGAGDAVFVEDEKHLDAARACGASCVIAPEGAHANLVGARSVIETAQPKLAFALIAEVLNPPLRRSAFVHPTASVASSAKVGEGVHVGACVVVGEGAEVGEGTQILAGSVVGERVRIGRECVLHPNVVLYDGVTLGDRVTLHAGVVVGADGFGYVRDEAGVYHKFPQVGTVRIEDDVEVGANTCVDRGALGVTRVGRGSKIDNLVQVGHNVEIGERVVIAAQTGISGSTVIESDAVIGGQVGFGDHARVLSGAVIGSQAGVLPGKIVRPGVWWGTPVQPLEEYKRRNALWGRLPRMREAIEELKRQVRELTARLDEKGE